ncbi:MAG TPA: sensor histidine kinase [Candidatus Pullichristensenella stercoripullorum]|nr:sensor histidine kinase [Candidatus Pullichristensenella stercoripullorum]
MRLLLQYLHLHRKSAVLLTVCALLFALVFFLYQLPVEAVLYACGLCLMAFVVLAGIDFSRFRARHLALERLRKNVSLGLDGMPAPADRIERDYQAALRALWDDRAHVVSRSDAAMSDMRDYYTLWAHQIKTPIAAMHLLVDEDGEAARELFKIEQYVDMLLSYIRLESDVNDLVLRPCDLDAILRAAARKYARFFIHQGLRLEIQPTGRQVLTDEKWFGFCVEQLLSNAVKYTPEGSISMYVENDHLVIADTGIGIAPEDLPRVFERGYTGYNGRTDRKSTGIGLYLTRRVLTMLGHQIHIDARPGGGTRVHISLKRPELSE